MAELKVRTLSKVLVEMHEDKHTTDRKARTKRQLVNQLLNIGLPVTQCNGLAVDVMWSIDGEPCMWDLKTPQDFLASAEDGRLHSQLKSMEEKGCQLYGFLIEGCVSQDGGVTVGYGTHAWATERFDNLLLSLQCEGAKVVYSSSPERTAVRLASLYRWSAKSERASWRAPKAPSYSLNRTYGDKEYRATIEGLMALLPGYGEERVVSLLDRFTVQQIMCGEADLKSVPGIGPKLSNTLVGVLGRDYRVGR